MNIIFKAIPKEQLLNILPLLKIVNTKTPPNLLEERVLEMGNYQNYECVAVYDDGPIHLVCPDCIPPEVKSQE